MQTPAEIHLLGLCVELCGKKRHSHLEFDGRNRTRVLPLACAMAVERALCLSLVFPLVVLKGAVIPHCTLEV